VWARPCTDLRATRVALGRSLRGRPRITGSAAPIDAAFELWLAAAGEGRLAVRESLGRASDPLPAMAATVTTAMANGTARTSHVRRASQRPVRSDGR